jgi:hypothetical protein
MWSLLLGQVVSAQNQTGAAKLKWDKSGVVVAMLPHNQYKVKMDGTGRGSLRNRMYLRAIVPYGAVGVPLPVSRLDQGPVFIVRMDQGPSPRAVPGGQEVSTTLTEDVVEMLRDVTDEEQEEVKGGVSEGASRVRKKPDCCEPGTWGTIKGRSGGPGR